ncbi:DNA binding protein [Haloarcula tailed virus 2]|uniref:Uncharacterized protein n=1 Tax=Haloarcula tailed virus 2 TaxID=2877989 RepID=A0AAE9BY60_9CAUD|nr:DNA binding protein [Haloarcula tailed virus 2]UBF23245.1 hypothetical protein HATV-2_gp94 [Haloarcula tailed virus 2]
MPLETVQILNTALHINGLEDLAFYGRGYVNHPCCTWAAKSRTNWIWLYHYANAIGDRFERERGKPHASITKMEQFDIRQIFEEMPRGNFTDPPQCMPDWCKDDDVVNGYRKYYYFVKSAEDWFDHSTCANLDWEHIDR